MLDRDTVRVVRFDLQPDRDWGGAEALLDAREHERAGRFRFERDRQIYVRSHAALRQVLARELGASPGELAFVEGPHRRPELAGQPLSFSLTHSGSLALVAVAAGTVGVDVEAVRTGIDAGVVSYLSASEQAALAGLEPEAQREAFFRTWVRKEAWLKARGTGLLAALADFDVSVPPAPAQLLATRPEAEEAARWILADVPVAEGWVAALARAAGPLRLEVSDGVGTPG